MRSVPAVLVLVGMLTGCATGVPPAIRARPAPDLSLTTVREQPSAHEGARVRWGGTIAAVENRADETWVEVVARELDRYGRPRVTDRSEGRFLARLAGFLDPAVYAVDRELTVAGVVTGETTRTIGQFSYRYPIIKADAAQLWERLPQRGDYYYYDPFWPYPWWYYPYPYHYPYPYGYPYYHR